MGTPQDYKKQVKHLINNLGEFNADYAQILAQLEDIRQSCTDGIVQEKVSVKDGVMQVIEKYPQVAQAAVMGKLAVLKELSRLAEMEVIEPQVNVVISLEALEVD